MINNILIESLYVCDWNCCKNNYTIINNCYKLNHTTIFTCANIHIEFSAKMLLAFNPINN